MTRRSHSPAGENPKKAGTGAKSGPAPRTLPRRSSRANRALLAGIAAAIAVALIAGFVGFARGRGPGSGRRSALDVPAGESAASLADRLHEAGLVGNASSMAWYLRLSRAAIVPGRHLVRDDLSPRELVQRLTRGSSRPRVKVTIPEGWNHQQIAARLGELEVTAPAEFAAAVFDASLLQELGLRGPSAEGYLFPATYELPVDSDPASILRTLVAEARKRLARVAERSPGALASLAARDGFDEHDIVTLASIVEREAADPAEHPLIASVFFNRLRDPSFRPQKTLESDPTAGYGCLVEPALAPSCAGYRGQITPALLRDPKNRYNTYRHPGLPPGPIANPGEHALGAVLAPATTDYLYFVATGQGHHTFSKTFGEHRNAITR